MDELSREDVPSQGLDARGSRGFVHGHGNVQINLNQHPPPALHAHTLALMAPPAAAERVAQLPHDEASVLLAVAPVEVSVPVLRVLLSRDEDAAVALLAEMHPARSRAILAELTSAMTGLEQLPTAAEAIYDCQERWRSVFGLKRGRLRRARTSQAGTHGFYQAFDAGAIYWSSRAGAQPTTGAIAAYHQDLGGTEGRLGFPVTPPDLAISHHGTAGVAQRFEERGEYPEDIRGRSGVPYGATVYDSDEYGPHATWGGIGRHYQQQGASGGWLGFPVTEECPLGPSRPGRETGDAGWWQRFEGGDVYYTDRTGVGFAVQGEIADHYDTGGGVTGRLGFPRSDVMEAATSQYGTSGGFQRFEGAWDYPEDLLEHCLGFGHAGGATVYTSHRHGTHTVQAGVGIHYERLGGTAGWLGFPTSGETDGRVSPGDPWCCYQRFEGGVIFWTEEYDAVAVTTSIIEALEQSPDVVADSLGYPTAAELALGSEGDRLQFFEHGVVTVRDGHAEVWVSASRRTSQPGRGFQDR